VYVVKIFTKNPELMAEEIHDDPVFFHLIASVNNERQNCGKDVLECFAVDARYNLKISNPKLSDKVMAAAESVKLHKDLGFLYENIEDLNDAMEYESFHACGIATTAQILAIEKYFFKRCFHYDTGEDLMQVFWNRGQTRIAKALYYYRQSNFHLRDRLGDICERVD
jgi:hypothetical protein